MRVNWNPDGHDKPTSQDDPTIAAIQNAVNDRDIERHPRIAKPLHVDAPHVGTLADLQERIKRLEMAVFGVTE